MAETKPPKVFISYAQEDDLKTWVLDFATRLRSDGINAILDQWETVPGDQLPEFMEKSVRESDFVVFVCTPIYKRKSDRRKGGVGYEGHVITGEVFSRNNHRKFIPILRKGKWGSSSPSWATSKLFIDFRGNPYSELSYRQLLDTLFGRLPIAPPLQLEVDDLGSHKSGSKTISSESIVADVNFDGDIPDNAQPIPDFLLPKVKKSNVVDEVKRETAGKSKPKDEKPETKTPKSSQDKVGVGGDVKDSVIVAGSGNVINIGEQKKSAPEKPKPEKPQPKKTKQPRKPNTAIIVALIGLAGTIVAALLGSPIIEKWFSLAPSATETATVTATLTSRPVTPSQAVEPSQTPTEIVVSTSTPLPTEITDAKDVTMRLIPAGSFVMGTYSKDALLQCQKYIFNCEESWFEDEEPPHVVVLSDYYIDKTEVTNAMYRECARTGACLPPLKYQSSTREKYYGDGLYDGYPVMNVTWSMATEYCEWRGARLPTEAEWEKAARGNDGRVYPWGNDFIYTAANYCDVNCSSTELNSSRDDGYLDTAPVGHYPQGKSYYGLFDMAGNVWEWVSDFYQENYYISLPDNALDPQGPLTGVGYVLRGGAANTSIHQLRSSARIGTTVTTYADYYVGFRCAKDATP